MHSPSIQPILAFALVSICAVGSPISAQNSGNVEVRGEGTEKSEKSAKNQKGEFSDGGDSNVDGKAADPGLMNPAALANFAFPHVTTRPRRLAPGESGFLVVVLALNTPAVVPAAAAVAMDYQPKQTVLDLGNYSVMPAKPGTLETKFKGQPVHDNTVTIEIPIAVSQQAQKGEVPVTLSLKTLLVNGTSGQPMGELHLPVSGRVTVGASVPRPSARDGERSDSVANAAALERPLSLKPESMPVAGSGKSEAKRVAGAATMTATNHDGVGLDVSFPEGSSLRPGGTLRVNLSVRVPPGQWLSRATPQSLGLAVSGADDGVEAGVGSWPAPSMCRFGALEAPASAEALSVPVTLSAVQDAALGMRTLEFRLTYSQLNSDGSPGAPQRLTLPAVLAVGFEPTLANPWIFYAVGGALSLLLALLVVRGLRR